MKVFIPFLAAIAVAQGFFGLIDHQPGLRRKFDLTSGFDKLPTTEEEAIENEFVLEKRPSTDYLPELKLYCPSDKSLGVLFDDTGYIAGVAIIVIEDCFTNCPKIMKNDTETTMAERGYQRWTTIIDGIEQAGWMLILYTIDPEAMKISAADRINNRDSTRLLQFGAIWVEGTEGITKISANEADIAERSDFTKQRFVSWMGQHYYYKMSTTTECTSEYLFPWFPLCHHGELIGVGYMMFGTHTQCNRKQDTFEHPPTAAVEFIVPEGPQCLYDLADECSVTTMHVYFLDNPRAALLFNN